MSVQYLYNVISDIHLIYLPSCLPVSLSVCSSVFFFLCPFFVCMELCLYVCVYFFSHVYLSVFLSVCTYVCMSACLFTSGPVCLSTCLSLSILGPSPRWSYPQTTIIITPHIILHPGASTIKKTTLILCALSFSLNWATDLRFLTQLNT